MILTATIDSLMFLVCYAVSEGYSRYSAAAGIMTGI